MGEVDYPGYAYGVAVALGGIMGYAKKRSVPSLVAGVAFGSLALYGAYSVGRYRVVCPNFGHPALTSLISVYALLRSCSKPRK